jgi:lipopolysaccharide/colanic/teichoic acid biosynthesis glycosyltransferase
MTGLAVDNPTTGSRAPGHGYYALARARDITLATTLLLVLAPLLVLVALLIKLETRGPVIFSQERTGSRRRTTDGVTRWERRSFRLHKFRSMAHHQADPTLHEKHIATLFDGVPTSMSTNGFKLDRDPRVTHVGRFIRRTSIDELPQLVNVLAGHMSLVGPRPVPLYESARYESWRPERFAALPGLTGYWQIEGRCLLSPRQMAELDAEYVRRQSFALDLKILLRTIPAVLSGRGAG